MIQAHMQELNFEDWLEQSEYVERVTDANIPHFAELLAAEEDCDSYAVSPAYYAFTGRRGLWLYHYDGTYLPMCWHPNIDGQILVFPPRGKKNYAAITALLDEAPAPPLGFLLARFKPQEISQLKTFYAFVRRVSFEPVEEEVLDWRYPARILSTLNTAQMIGHDYMLIRNRVRQTHKYSLDVQPLSIKHIPEIETLALRWANRQAERPDELIDLITPYKETLRLLKHKKLGLDGLVFIAEGQIQAVTMWDISNPVHKVANLYMNLCNVTYRGLSEFSIQATALKLCADGVPLLNLGGSETAGLDHYKNKFAPVLSVTLCSLEASMSNTSTVIKTPDAFHELRIA
ncbi:MAG: phosphatidylglycerol lysyltransferase domain-containing protein [Alphaproteobacteria bacterium]